MRSRMVAAAAVLSLGTVLPTVASPCTFWWQNLADDAAGCLESSELRPLLDYAMRAPSLVDRGSVAWTELPRPAHVSRIGAMEGHRLYEVTYPGNTRLLIVEREPWQFAPLLLLDGAGYPEDTWAVASIARPRLFHWDGRTIASVRLQYSGMGALQKSLFLAVVDGAVVPLVEEASERVQRWVADHAVTVSHRGGGFCEDTLLYENWAGTSRPEDGNTLRIVYKIEGQKIVVDTVGLIDYADQSFACRNVFAKGIQKEMRSRR
jgi:hypothetical protein